MLLATARSFTSAIRAGGRVVKSDRLLARWEGTAGADCSSGRWSDDPLMLASYSQMKAAAAEDNKQFLSLRPEAPKDPLAIDARKRAAAF
jgi:hypothetical protein